MNSDNLLFLGTIKKAHGVKGEILVTIDNENIKFTNDLKAMWLGESLNHISSWEIEKLKVSNEKVFLKLRNVETPEEAKFLKGLNVYVDMEVVEELSIFDTIGYDLLDDNTEEFIGKISDIEKSAMQDLIVFEHKGEIKMIPVVTEFVKFIDWDEKKVYVELIEGLI